MAPLGPAWTASPEQWDWIIGVNLLGVVNGVRSFVPRMIDQPGESHIVNTASLAALRSVPMSGMYNATKHAVLGYTENLRGDLAQYGIGVSALCPGAVMTNIGESMGRMPGAAPSGEEMERSVAALAAGWTRPTSLLWRPRRSLDSSSRLCATTSPT